MSLSGKTIVVTRDANQAKLFVDLLEKQNADVYLFPTIKLTDADNTEIIKDIAARINEFDWIIFTSAIAIRFFICIIESYFIYRLTEYKITNTVVN